MQTIRSRSFAFAGAILATFASVTGVSSAHAETFGESPARQEAVSIAGLDLASPQGMKALDRRIRSAANRVCATNDRSTVHLVRACRHEAITTAMNSLPVAARQQLAAR